MILMIGFQNKPNRGSNVGAEAGHLVLLIMQPSSPYGVIIRVDVMKYPLFKAVNDALSTA